MKRTISAEVGKGNLNHNRRKFTTQNVDPTRTHLNINYCDEPLQQAYHRLFDAALERYNAKQTRSDRKIEDYYEKIRSGKQEKPFHELVIQIGNREDTGSATETGELAKKALDAFFRGFQERNPNLHVFSAHLHMDESTPHIHIDFIPFVTGSSRGLDTRVSLKKALASQGFRGGTRQETEWNQWARSEKQQLAQSMARYGFEWEQKGTHKPHLSVIEYKKQERARELIVVENSLAEKSQELDTVIKRINNLDDAGHQYQAMEQKLDRDPSFQLTDPPRLTTAKTYKSNYAEPLVNRLKQIILHFLLKYYKAKDNYLTVNKRNNELKKANDCLTNRIKKLEEENIAMRKQARDYAILQKELGLKRLTELVNHAREAQKAKRPPSKDRNDVK